MCSIWGRILSRSLFSTQNSIKTPLKKRTFLTINNVDLVESSSNIKTDDLQEFDKTQVGLLAERCILVNEKDEPIGGASKKECHLWQNISQKGLLHRAFSVLLFNSNNQMLIQQRSAAKITYPFHFTNTCCSHPLFVEAEAEDVIGVKRAAQRRLHYELGIPLEQVPPDLMTLLTRIHYIAPNRPDTRWGEHEIDYILVIKKDVDLDINRNEVNEVRYVSQTDLKSMLAQSRIPSGADVEGIASDNLIMTPWFRLLCERDGGLLFKCWDRLENLSSLRDDLIHNWT